MDFPMVAGILEQPDFEDWEQKLSEQGCLKMAKAEILQVASEQEKAWMSMRYSLEDLERRLHVIEIEKVQLEDILQTRLINRALKAPEQRREVANTRNQDSLVDYSSLYVSEIYEDKRGGYEDGKCSVKKLQMQLTSFSDVGEEHEDLNWQMETQKLRAEVRRLEGELRAATQEQVTVDILEDAPGDLSDAASSEQASYFVGGSLEFSPTSKRQGSEDEDVRYLVATKDCEGDVAFLNRLPGQLSQVFEKQERRMQAFLLSLKKRGLGSLEMLKLHNTFLRLVIDLNHQLARLSKTLDLSCKDAADMPSWIAVLETALDGLQNDEAGSCALGVEQARDESISKPEGKLEAQEQCLALVMEKHAQELQRKEKTIEYAQQLNTQLAAELTKAEAELAEVRSQRKGLQACVEMQLKESRNASIKGMEQELANSELKILGLQRVVADKDSQLQELRRRISAIQNETDATVMEKFDLLQNLRDLRKEADAQKGRITELVTINQEALQFAQMKEEQVVRLQLQVTEYEKSLLEKSDACVKLTEELREARTRLRTAADEKEKEHLLKSALKEKVMDLEYELIQREAALERLTKHLAAIEKGQASFHAEPLRVQYAPIRTGHSKDHSCNSNQFRQSKVVIRDLEEKLGSMESEFSRVRIQMAEIKADKTTSLG